MVSKRYRYGNRKAFLSSLAEVQYFHCNHVIVLIIVYHYVAFKMFALNR